eukprot:CAMPEP_0204542590 /NCGR_PEP_ID=MMETSP0661-20131031/19092_1 /ASSEMBLY_ACC=CAM_ASM_000606 /TAXON_ID=109239 /ORGANISM="Alexandrium margalefi, Strain AMGDE01CS-322" /LENGTH=95 /DNA_ID=CAMNT_0051549297 /DNA_START=108 /DNA_END=395 /DNA_ORIENTATION=+
MKGYTEWSAFVAKHWWFQRALMRSNLPQNARFSNIMSPIQPSVASINDSMTFVSPSERQRRRSNNNTPGLNHELTVRFRNTSLRSRSLGAFLRRW